VAGTRARGVSVADIRSQVAAVDAASGVDAARNLLAKVRPDPLAKVRPDPLAKVRPDPPFVPELDKVHFNHAMTKINVLGLLSTSPLDLATGEPVDISRLLERGNPLRPIVPGSQVPHTESLANRVVALGGSQRAVLTALATAPERVAASHLVDAESQDQLRQGDHDRFLDRRAELVRSTIAHHVQRMAEWGARDGRALADIVRSAA
jgi:hypothetical protein